MLLAAVRWKGSLATKKFYIYYRLNHYANSVIDNKMKIVANHGTDDWVLHSRIGYDSFMLNINGFRPFHQIPSPKKL